MRCQRLLTLLVVPLLAQTPLLAQSVTFQRSAAQRGETSEQRLDCDLDLVMSIRQSGQIIQQQQQALKRQQNRVLTILEAGNGVPIKARVEYRESSIALKAVDQPPQETAQPVAGKTYLVSRIQDELKVTYPDGSTPPEAELLIVKQNMATFGMANPIATFFHQKTVKVGDTLRLPADLAAELLGFANTQNNPSDFRMTLMQVRRGQAGGSPVAVFKVELKADDAQASGVAMTLNGQMLMEVNSCRTLEVNLSGPVTASENHGPEEASYQIHTQGDIKVAVRANRLR